MKINRITSLYKSNYPAKPVIKSCYEKNKSNPGFDTSDINSAFNLHNRYLVGFTSARTFSTDKSELAEKSGNFIPSKIDGLTCPACGKKMLTREHFEEIAEELSELSPDEYLDYLGNYREYMPAIEGSVYDEIYNESQKPNASKDIRTLLVQLRESKLPVLQEAQMYQLKKMQKLAATLPQSEQKSLLRKLNKLKKEILRKNSLAPFRRKTMLARIQRTDIKNPDKYNKLQAIAKNFPTSNDLNSAWIVKYSGQNKMDKPWDSYNIALRMLSTSVANTDHIMAYSKFPNHDDISNYMSMHNACNCAKADKSFLQWINEDKENRVKNTVKYFNEVQANIDNGKIKDDRYKNYVKYAANTIYEASNKTIDIRTQPS
ncbi:MAG: hypothetical protein LUG16_04405 [Candidatus Gastranaerophilales bacterium]|nr:hypothetical protein [Candidatus Gastranaerophilales bacterium]